MDEKIQDKSFLASLCSGNEAIVIGVMLEPKDNKYLTMNKCVVLGYAGKMDDRIKQYVINKYEEKLKEELERVKLCP